jgi:hypothetical protein
MRTLHAPRLEDIGAITIGTHHYWVQHYYPNGGTQCLVYVFKRHSPERMGVVFKDQADYVRWSKAVPAQLPLW